MSVSSTLRDEVRERANYCCQYCGTSETETGGELTLDHFQPVSSGGTDDILNLIYCCFRCNIYKGEYWHSDPDAALFHPLKDKYEEHFWLSDSGNLIALSDVGARSLNLLRLNRPPLVAKRCELRSLRDEQQILEQTNALLETLKGLSQQQRGLLKEQQSLLEEQRRLLELLYRK